MPFYHFPSEFVYWTQISDHDKLKEKIKPEIQNLENLVKDSRSFSLCNVISSYPHTDPYNLLLKDDQTQHSVVWKPITTMLEEMSKKDGVLFAPFDHLIIEGGWFNIYKKNQFQELHNHDGNPSFINGRIYHPFLSLIYILDNPNDTNDTAFKMREAPCHPRKSDVCFMTSEEKSIKEGTVMIFPSTTNHVVAPSSNDGRITIAYNVLACFK
jgi:hypothetical protein